MNSVKLSACIVTYNNAGIISNTIEAMLKYTKDFDLDFFVFDNLSQDNTCDIIKSKFPTVKLIESDINLGFGQGHNMIINTIHSKYHFIVNPDAIINKDTFPKIIDFFENNEDVAMLCPKILNADLTEQILPVKNPTVKYLSSRSYKIFRKIRASYTRASERNCDVMDIEVCTGSFMVARTDLLKQVGGFDDRFFMYLEDADISRRVKKLGRIVMLRTAYIVHMWERASSKKLKFLLIHIKSSLKYLWKWRNEK